LLGATQVRIRIADITFALVGLTREWTWTDQDRFEAFTSEGASDILLNVHAGDGCSQLSSADMVYSVEGLRNVYLCEDRWAFEFHPYKRLLYPQRPPHQVLIFDRRFTEGDLYVSADSTSERHPFSFGLFLPELLSDMLPFYSGMMLHASGISHEGRGIVFAGPSGAGKSTIAGLWQRRDGIGVLNDDRMIVRKKGEQWWAYPAAGMGELGPDSTQAAVLEAVFLVSHSQQNLAERMGMAQAASSLLPHISLPPYDAVAVSLGLDLLDDLLQKVPVYQLGFLPDDSAIDCIKGTIPWGEDGSRP